MPIFTLRSHCVHSNTHSLINHLHLSVALETGTDKITVKGTPLATAQVGEKLYYFAVNKPKVRLFAVCLHIMNHAADVQLLLFERQLMSLSLTVFSFYSLSLTLCFSFHSPQGYICSNSAFIDKEGKRAIDLLDPWLEDWRKNNADKVRLFTPLSGFWIFVVSVSLRQNM